MSGLRTPDAPAHPQRLLAAALVAVLAAAYSARTVGPAGQAADLTIQWASARAFWSGTDAYALSGPGRPIHWVAPLAYPATTLVALGPLAALPISLARSVFVALSAGAYTFAVTGRGWAPLLTVLAWPFVFATYSVQWSPLIVTAALLPPLAWLAACKPTIGMVAAAYGLSRRWLAWAAIGGATLAAIGFVRQPDWLQAWLSALSRPTGAAIGTVTTAAAYTAPIAFPGGALVALALSKWRRPEARALVMLAAVPQTLSGYELVLLLALVPMGWIEVGLLTACSWLLRTAIMRQPSLDTFTGVMQAAGAMSVMWMFLPALLLVLRRPNEGPAPAWLDRLLERSRAPGWLRGRAPHEIP